jgi:hypothetical protein
VAEQEWVASDGVRGFKGEGSRRGAEMGPSSCSSEAKGRAGVEARAGGNIVTCTTRVTSTRRRSSHQPRRAPTHHTHCNAPHQYQSDRSMLASGSLLCRSIERFLSARAREKHQIAKSLFCSARSIVPQSPTKHPHPPLAYSRRSLAPTRTRLSTSFAARRPIYGRTYSPHTHAVLPCTCVRVHFLSLGYATPHSTPQSSGVAVGGGKPATLDWNLPSSDQPNATHAAQSNGRANNDTNASHSAQSNGRASNTANDTDASAAATRTRAPSRGGSISGRVKKSDEGRQRAVSIKGFNNVKGMSGIDGVYAENSPEAYYKVCATPPPSRTPPHPTPLIYPPRHHACLIAGTRARACG